LNNFQVFEGYPGLIFIGNQAAITNKGKVDDGLDFFTNVSRLTFPVIDVLRTR
jgi:hypothetical protein